MRVNEMRIEAVKRILTVHHGVTFHRNICRKAIYRDSLMQVHQNQILRLLWIISSLQLEQKTTNARYSTEAEYRALASAIAEIVWIRKCIHLITSSTGSSTLYCIVKSAIAIARNPVLRTKHIKIDHHFVREREKLKICAYRRRIGRYLHELKNAFHYFFY